MGRQSGQMSMIILDIAELLQKIICFGKSNRWFDLT